jgi:hypothetical protein
VNRRESNALTDSTAASKLSSCVAGGKHSPSKDRQTQKHDSTYRETWQRCRLTLPLQ